MRTCRLRAALVAAAIAGVLAGVLAGCAIPSPPPPEALRRDALGALDLVRPWRAGEATAGALRDNWLATFGDPQLDALVAEAIARNPDLRVAAARVQQARGQLDLAKAAQRPSLALLATGGVKMTDLSSALTGVVALVSWELDLWGNLRLGRAAAEDLLVAARADEEFARQSLAATTARAWIAATQTRLEVQEAERMLQSGQRLAGLADDRLRVGVGNALDLATAQASVTSQRDLALQAAFAHQSALRALELLLGRYPAAELAARASLPVLPGPVPAGLPLQMLERRPDLLAAERRVAAAFNRLGQARVASLPSLKLTGNLGYLDSDVLQLAPGYDNPAAGVGARLAMPVDINGEVDAQVAVRSAQQDEAVAEYARLALRAIGDVETALATGQVLAGRERLLDALVADRGRSLAFMQSSFDVGRQDLRAVTQQELGLHEARIQLLRVQADQLVQRVNLHLALGGSFDAATPSLDGTAPGGQRRDGPAAAHLPAAVATVH